MTRYFRGTITYYKEAGDVWFSLGREGRSEVEAFPISSVQALADWLDTASSWRLNDMKKTHLTVEYWHLTGKLNLHTPNKTYIFDPNNDEDMAKFVRKVKSFAEIPHSEQPPIPGLLPRPTEEEYANRIIYTIAKPAQGIKPPVKEQTETEKLDARNKILSLQSSLMAKLRGNPNE